MPAANLLAETIHRRGRTPHGFRITDALSSTVRRLLQLCHQVRWNAGCVLFDAHADIVCQKGFLSIGEKGKKSRPRPGRPGRARSPREKPLARRTLPCARRRCRPVRGCTGTQVHCPGMKIGSAVKSVRLVGWIVETHHGLLWHGSGSLSPHRGWKDTPLPENPTLGPKLRGFEPVYPWDRPRPIPSETMISIKQPKLTGGAILVFRASTSVPAAPA